MQHQQAKQIQLVMFPESVREQTWVRDPGSGPTCGATWHHKSGWMVCHCGHPTANYPYYLVMPSGRVLLDPVTGRGFMNLAAAQAEVERRTDRKWQLEALRKKWAVRQ